MMIEIKEGYQYCNQIKKLVLEYYKELNRNLDFQNINDELNDIALKYARPEGMLLVALCNEKVVGCVAYQRLSETTCEMKRLFVTKKYRSKHIGRQLVDHIIQATKLNGYHEMVLDTIEPLKYAIELYKSFGFEKTEAYYDNPMDDVIYMKLDLGYTKINSHFFDKWNEEDWEWGRPITHVVYEKALHNDWDVLLTPTKPVPHDWFCDMKDAKILGLASGGGQQMPIFSALGAHCTVLDYSTSQLESERMVADREKYTIEIVQADMTEPLPFEDESFDLIFHPVSNCYVENVLPIWKECYRVLKHGGILLAGLDNGIGYVFNDEGTDLEFKLPFNPLKDKGLYQKSIENDWGIQFSHTIEEQVGGQLKAGFILTDIFQDTDGEGRLHEFGIPTFYATRAIKQ